MSRPYAKILVPYDGSTYSKRALDMAIGIAGTFGSMVHLVNVIDISTASPPGMVLSQGTRKRQDQIRASVKVSTEAHLQKVQSRYKDSGVTIKKTVLEGDTTSKLLKFIQDNDINMVIIGSRGLSGISKIMALGSTSRKISEMAKCPVVIVR